MIPHYDRKFIVLLLRQHGYCPIRKDRLRPPTELHHRLHYTRPNRRRFPLLINSLWNLMAVNHDNHMEAPSCHSMTLLEAQKREAFLARHPLIAEYLNTGSHRPTSANPSPRSTP